MVKQSFLYAYMWGNIASSNGFEYGKSTAVFAVSQILIFLSLQDLVYLTNFTILSRDSPQNSLCKTPIGLLVHGGVEI